MVPTSDLPRATLRMLSDPGRRSELAAAGRAYYDAHFAVGHTLDALLGAS